MRGLGALDGLQGKRLYSVMSAACGAAFMLYGWDAGTSFHILSYENVLANQVSKASSVVFNLHRSFSMPLATQKAHLYVSSISSQTRPAEDEL
jgi:hypothetical protein